MRKFSCQTEQKLNYYYNIRDKQRLGVIWQQRLEVAGQQRLRVVGQAGRETNKSYDELTRDKRSGLIYVGGQGTAGLMRNGEKVCRREGILG